MREKKVIRCYFLLDYFKKFNPTRDIQHKHIREELLDNDCWYDPDRIRPYKVRDILRDPYLFNMQAYEDTYELIEKYKHFDKLANKSKNIHNEVEV